MKTNKMPRPSVKKRLKIIRQTRYRSECVSLLIEQEYAPVRNFSAFGIALEKNMELSGRLSNVPFYVGRTRVAAIQLKVSRNRPHTAFEIIGSPLNIDEVCTIENGYRIISDLLIESKKHAFVPDALKIVVFELKEFLEVLKIKLDSIEQQFTREQSLTHAIKNHLSKLLTETYHNVSSIIKPLSDISKDACIQFFRQHLHYLYLSPFVERCYKKPCGYAGDHKMMHMIYENRFTGKSLFARCINSVFLDIGATRAVRNRAQYFVSKLVSLLESNANNRVRILSMASGPAIEMEYLILHWQEMARPIEALDQAEFYFFDHDEDALTQSQLRLITIAQKLGLNTRFEFLNISVRDIVKNKLSDLKQFDLIYAAGLFDYLDDRFAHLVAGALYDKLNQNGRLIIGNFDKSNPDQLMMELVMDWPLIYRSADELRNLFGHLAIPVIEEEPENINLFCLLHKTP